MAEPTAAASHYGTYIASALATPGGYLSIGPFGFTLSFSRDGWLSGYDSDAVKAECCAAGLPIIDTREVPFEARLRLAMHGSLVAVGEPPDDPPWHALSRVPLRVVAAAYRAARAETVNIPDRPAVAEDEGTPGLTPR